ncbi:MAG: DNA repair protein [Desulfobacterales bacterium RIFOXYA12_FULL_46_15]|nr:MAG: DNA repair protein [Desulfobacterales bacterium RIFOXYA12_FULL_46_15]
MKQTYAGTVARLFLMSVIVLFVSGCNTVYYKTMEQFGKEKRHILKEDVKDVRQSQTKAQREFQDALTTVRELYGFQGGNLEQFYDRLKNNYEDCESRANQIEKRINTVEEVAGDLFKEWDAEIAQIQDPDMKNSSRQSYADSKEQYQKLQGVMKNSTKGMYPVLAKLRDNVLYLKHNLNAKTVGVLGGEVASIEQDVEKLIFDMNASVDEAENFLNRF